MDLVFERRGARTILAHAYAEPPFRVGSTLDLDGAAYVILVCTGPGVFAGDTLRQTITVARGAQVVLASQSALQAHPSRADGPARIVHEYDVDEDAELYVHWDPIIPFEAARIEQRFELRLAPSSRVYWSDAVMSGRVTRSEAWRFTVLAHELRVTTARGPQRAALRYLERYRLAPRSAEAAAEGDATPRSIAHPWILGPANYLATALLHDERGTPVLAEALQRRMATLAGVRTGVDAVEPGLIVARLAAASGAPFAAARTLLREAALQSIFGRPNLVGRK